MRRPVVLEHGRAEDPRRRRERHEDEVGHEERHVVVGDPAAAVLAAGDVHGLYVLRRYIYGRCVFAVCLLSIYGRCVFAVRDPLSDPLADPLSMLLVFQTQPLEQRNVV